MGMITTMIYNLADTIFIAKTGNPKLVAGVTIGAPLFTLLLAIADIFGLGGSSVASRLLGEKHYDQVKRVNSFLHLWRNYHGNCFNGDPTGF